MLHDRLEIARAQLVVVDVQARLLPHIAGHADLVAQVVRMIRAARELGLPITISEQYPQGLGHTDEDVRAAAADAPVVQKMTFSVCGDEAAWGALLKRQRPQVLLVGIETHVCVQQTALDLQRHGLQPAILTDAVGSRQPTDHLAALERLRTEGVLLTTVESAIYELMVRSDAAVFKRVLPIVR